MPILRREARRHTLFFSRRSVARWILTGPHQQAHWALISRTLILIIDLETQAFSRRLPRRLQGVLVFPRSGPCNTPFLPRELALAPILCGSYDSGHRPGLDVTGNRREISERVQGEIGAWSQITGQGMKVGDFSLLLKKRPLGYND